MMVLWWCYVTYFHLPGSVMVCLKRHVRWGFVVPVDANNTPDAEVFAYGRVYRGVSPDDLHTMRQEILKGVST
jgi:hypothetical protein